MFTDQEAEALGLYECSSGSKPTAKSRDAQLPINLRNTTNFKERMARNHSSLQFFFWGYNVYIPAAIVAQSLKTLPSPHGEFRNASA